jgi:thiosulfate/3-mercaptopyruvate sulfurtransferase
MLLAGGCTRLHGVSTSPHLTSVAELAAELASARPPVVLDVRWRLGGPSCLPEHRDSHIPGAAFVDLEEDLAGPAGAGGRHPLPGADTLQAALRRSGVSAGDRVVVYDHGDGVAAGRAWWMLRWAGLGDVAVLDGGWAAWRAAAAPVTAESSRPEPGDVVVRPGAMPVLDAEEAAVLAHGGVLLDARTPERYRGEHEPVDPVAGHIPGALSAPASDYTGPDGCLLPAGELRARFAALGAQPGVAVGAYCGSGVTAARTVLALAVAGVPASLYVGSWSDWVTDPDRPVATGPDPE